MTSISVWYQYIDKVDDIVANHDNLRHKRISKPKDIKPKIYFEYSSNSVEKKYKSIFYYKLCLLPLMPIGNKNVTHT